MQPVQYFTLNYDTLLEDALALAQIRFADGFAGGATGWWDPLSYDNQGVDAKLYKLHGSIDWCSFEDDALPRRIRHGLTVPESQRHVLIWPAATKYREAQRDPYAALINHFRKSLQPTASEQVTLCICGYSFGDEHINAEIESAMRQAGDGLTAIVLTSEPEPVRKLQQWSAHPEIGQRLKIYADGGFFHGDQTIRSDTSLHWWKFEHLTRILGGFR